MTISQDVDFIKSQVKSIIWNRDTEPADREYIRQMGEIKRILERYVADDEFREEFEVDPAGAIKKYNLDVSIDPMEIRLLWDDEYLKAWDPEQIPPLPVIRYRAFIKEKIQHRTLIQSGNYAPTNNTRYKVWRDRQMKRCRSELGPFVSDHIVHASLTLELSKGCTVGCWFCGVDAPKMTDIFTYTPENAKLWVETLQAVKDVIGEAAARSFCYWATDPLDNPDYEKFLIDFHAVVGKFPQTTTAQPMKDPAKIRSILRLANEKGGFIDRFSILSVGMLRRVHAEFSAEELAFVELVTQNKEAKKAGKHSAGRARMRNRKLAEKNNQEYPDDKLSGTIACVSGFLFNMVERSVKLITPCSANERWPLGYQIFQQGNFTDGDSLRALLTDMVNNHMTTSVRHDTKIAFRKDLTYEELPDGYVLVSAYLRNSFKFKGRDVEIFKFLTGKIAEGKSDAGELAIMLEEKFDVPLEKTFYNLNSLLDSGFLDEEPEVKI